KQEAKLRARLAIAHVDAAAHGRRQLLDEREADARAGRLARQAVRGPVEELEDLAHLTLRDAGAVISDGEEHRAAAFAPAGDDDRLALRTGRELERVIDQVDRDLREAIGVDRDRGVAGVV